MCAQNTSADGGDGNSGGFQIRLQDTGEPRTKPSIDVSLWTRAGEELERSTVAEDGRFDVSADALKRAEIVRIGPLGANLECLTDIGLSLRSTDFTARLREGALDIAPGLWEAWFPIFQCVSGRTRVCRPGQWWFDDLAAMALEPVASARRIGAASLRARTLAPASSSSTTNAALISAPQTAQRLSPAASIDELIAWPFNCAPICEARIEVYRRVCCCDPWIVFDPRLKELVCRLEEVVPDFPQPHPPTPFERLRTPAPVPEVSAAFFQSGALDRQSVNAATDLRALRSLPPEAIPTYVNGRPYLFCPSYDCDPPVQVAEGSPGLDGRFSICWPSFPILLQPGCHFEYAYRVYQPFGQFEILVYDGVSAGNWFAADDDPTLTSYSPFAYGCRINPAGRHVFLNAIADTGAHQLNTPNAASAIAVSSPDPTSGTAYPVPDPLSSVTDRNWGGTLKINLTITEGMQDAGAKYYRISVVEADADGAPALGATRHDVTTVPAWLKSEAGGDIVPVSLGPNSVDGQNALFEIPYDTNPTTDWLDNQFHALLDTNDVRWSDPTVRHLITVEIFDESGDRLRPTGTDPTGLGGDETEAAFTFRRRFQETGSTLEVPYGALTHMFWWDNREMVADIEDLRLDLVANNNECQFLVGTAASTFSIGYRAFHENQLFHASHSISWRRGLGNTANSSGTLPTSSPMNVGGPPGAAPVGASGTETFGNMLQTESRCAFSLWLNVYNKITDGDDMGLQYRGDTAAVVLEVDN
ncbi:hypothetical protein [Roseobacter sinensis]|uniref:Carboxypeptidase regulatory-like domain-containing protein n=1 Tax=Roseobacter sinensis TaxID=2931391 RepID=A0ABT3BGM6_9RHOB|nr:hypothetical protein [Roseobacter sp. WL0113]MCV3272690.1 hypothetical protein [Roseobacter sp. WL0113]